MKNQYGIACMEAKHNGDVQVQIFLNETADMTDALYVLKWQRHAAWYRLAAGHLHQKGGRNEGLATEGSGKP